MKKYFMKKGSKVESITYSSIQFPWEQNSVMIMNTCQDFYFTEKNVRHDYGTFVRVDLLSENDDDFKLSFRVYKDYLKITDI